MDYITIFLYFTSLFSQCFHTNSILFALNEFGPLIRYVCVGVNHLPLVGTKSAGRDLPEEVLLVRFHMNPGAVGLSWLFGHNRLATHCQTVG